MFGVFLTVSQVLQTVAGRLVIGVPMHDHLKVSKLMLSLTEMQGQVTSVWYLWNTLMHTTTDME